MRGSLTLRTLRARPGRAVALGSGILLATAAFATLTGAASTSQLEVTGTAKDSFRGVYDILVRPPGAQTRLESSAGLVRANYLSGIFGGITLAQWKRVEGLTGVQVAAPIAMVGYTATVSNVPVVLNPALTAAPRQLFRVNQTWTSDGGLTRVTDTPSFAFVTHHTLYSPGSFTDSQVISEDGPTGPGVCSYPIANPDAAATAFAPSNRTDLECWSTVNGLDGDGLQANDALARGQIGVNVRWAFPLLIAAIDPVAEAELDHFDRTVVAGRYMTEADVGHSQAGYVNPLIPVLAASSPAETEALTATVQRLPDAVTAGAVGHPLDQDSTASRLAHTGGPTVSTLHVDAARAYRLLLSQLRGTHGAASVAIYWPVGKTSFTTTATTSVRSHRLAVAAQPSPADATWQSLYQGGYARVPIESDDTAFRPLGVVQLDSSKSAPRLQAVGTFDPDRLQQAESGFFSLNNADLETFNNPHLTPADARSRSLLHGADLEPNGNLTGYSQQPPQLLTTLGGLKTLDTYFPGAAARPISVIRVRVAGVVGSDPASRERVRLVAQRIQAATGLNVDITAGSSSDPQTITLPAGRFGRPQLTLTEPWAKKGAVLSLITAVDRKSALLFALVLTVCALFVANGASAAVRARRRELGILSSLGWTPRNITASVLGELLVLGAAAGVLGAAVAIPLGRVLRVHVAGEHALLAAPAAVLLALVAGLIPAVRAGRTAPLAAIAPAVHPGRRARWLRTVTALAAAQVARTPARTVVAAVSVAIGVGALTLVLAVRLTFQNSVVGTVLGDAVSIQVRGPDIIAVALTVVLGLFSVGDVVYLSVRERSAELATLRATGWTDAHLIRLLTTEGTLLGLLGAVLGVTAGLYGSWRLTGTVPGSLLLLAAVIGVGSVLATVAVAVALASTVTRLPTARLLAGD